jgi:CDP-paratose 2-epimerase
LARLAAPRCDGTAALRRGASRVSQLHRDVRRDEGECTIYGYKGKQVRDQIHSHDQARLFLEFYAAPRCGEVYNLGGGGANSLSILETIEILESLGYKMRYSYNPADRIGDHICYISDLTKIRAHFLNWRQEYRIRRIVEGTVQRYAVLANTGGKRGI